MIRSSGLIKDELILDKIDLFLITLRLMGYYVDIKINEHWESINMRVTQEAYHIRAIVIIDVLVNVTDGKVDELFVKCKDKNGEVKRLYYGKGEYKPEYFDKLLDEALIYI